MALERQGWDRRSLHSLMGKRVPYRMSKVFGQDAVETLRYPEGRSFPKVIPEGEYRPANIGRYALHRVVQSANPEVVGEPSTSYGASGETYDTMDFKTFLASCPALGEFDLEPISTDTDFESMGQ